jgi:hypothetical protein
MRRIGRATNPRGTLANIFSAVLMASGPVTQTFDCMWI